MFLTRFLFAKAGWRPRSLSTPGRQWIGKNRRIRPFTRHMRKGQNERAAIVAQVEKMTEFSYLTPEECVVSEDEIDKQAAEERRLKWQRRTLGNDVFGLGLGKPSVLDHLMVTDTRRYKKNE